MSARSVLEWLEDAARLAPDAVAFEQPDKAITWNGVRHRARAVGSALASLIPLQSPVLILMEKSADCLCAMLGAVYAGCFYTPLDSSMPEARMRLIVKTLQPAAVVYEEKFADAARRIAGNAALLCCAEIAEEADGVLLSERRKGQPAIPRALPSPTAA